MGVRASGRSLDRGQQAESAVAPPPSAKGEPAEEALPAEREPAQEALAGAPGMGYAPSFWVVPGLVPWVPPCCAHCGAFRPASRPRWSRRGGVPMSAPCAHRTKRTRQSSASGGCKHGLLRYEVNLQPALIVQSNEPNEPSILLLIRLTLSLNASPCSTSSGSLEQPSIVLLIRLTRSLNTSPCSPSSVVLAPDAEPASLCVCAVYVGQAVLTKK